MATFIQLCQKTARESQTVSGTYPTSVSDQTGWLLQIVKAVVDAWENIQNKHPDWRWMRADFEGDTISGTARYTAAGWSLTRFAEWITEPDVITIYKDSTGVSDEGPLTFKPWQEWQRLYDRGTQTANRPVHWSISPTNEFCLGPKPDAVYTVRGPYRKGNQTLANNTDEPEGPGRFHNAIVYEALEILAGFDETPAAVVTARSKLLKIMDGLERDQLPRLELGGDPIA